jgi:hypothetical protein
MSWKNAALALLGLACCLPSAWADDKTEKAWLDVGYHYHVGKLFKVVHVGPQKQVSIAWKLKSGQWTYDLDFDDNRLEELEKAAACLDGQMVRVAGILERREFGLYVSAIEPWGHVEKRTEVEMVGRLVWERKLRMGTLRVGDVEYELFFGESKEVKWQVMFCERHAGEMVRVKGLLEPGWGGGRIRVGGGPDDMKVEPGQVKKTVRVVVHGVIRQGDFENDEPFDPTGPFVPRLRLAISRKGFVVRAEGKDYTLALHTWDWHTATKLVGRSVVVTGTLIGDNYVNVETIHADGGFPETQKVLVTVEGTLEARPGPAYRLHAGNQVYDLDLVYAKPLYWQAAELKGRTVRVEGELVGGISRRAEADL